MNLLKSITLYFLLGGVASASPIFSALPSGTLLGAPGQAIPIQFNLSSDNDYWISVIAVTTQNETNPTLGVFEDLTYTQGGPAGIILAVDAPNFTGELGTYTIDPSAPIGASNSGTFWLFYERYSDNPLTCNNCLVGTDFTFADFTVQAAAVPEPATLLLSTSALALIARSKRRR